jgi:hypothetical protein
MRLRTQWSEPTNQIWAVGPIKWEVEMILPHAWASLRAWVPYDVVMIKKGWLLFLSALPLRRSPSPEWIQACKRVTVPRLEALKIPA